MSVILVVEQDASSAKKVTKALRADGLDVQTVDSGDAAIQTAAAQETRLVIVNAALAKAKELLSGFSRQRGGPGSIALVAAAVAQDSTAEDFAADELLAVPFSDDELSSTVARCLAASPGRHPNASRSDKSTQLTSADIFGDVLAEVEAEAQSRPKPRRRPARESDIESKLEATLSGVMPGARSKTVRRKRKAQSTGDIDLLLDKTLSSLELPKRKKRRTPATTETAATKSSIATEGTDSGEALEPPAAVPEPAEASPAEPQQEEPQQEEPQLEEKSKPKPVSKFSQPRHKDESKHKSGAPVAAPTEDARTSEDGGPKAALDGVLQLRGEDQFRTQALPTIPLGADTAEGTAFGDYTLLKRIAVGGMAEVWLARRRGVEGFQKTVAIKKILMHLTGTADFVTMFIDEAKLAAQLNHNNIIQIYDLGKVDDDFFIAMEYVDGKDLRSILTSANDLDHPVPLELALMVVAAVARALHYAHRKRDFDNRAMGLVHRDVSPQNVLISHEGEIKLCDFGIVKAVAKASITQMGALKGKLQYMSPEQAWGKPVDSRSDLFSLGSVLFELLTGDKLFSGDSEIGVLDAVRECRVRSPRDLVPDIPEEVVEIVKKALAKNPDDRYQTAGAMEKDMTAVLNGLEPTLGQSDLAGYLRELYHPGKKSPKPAVVAPAPPSKDKVAIARSEGKVAKSSPESKSRAPLMIVGGLVAAAIIAVVGIQIGGDRTPADPASSAAPAEGSPAGVDGSPNNNATGTEPSADGAFGIDPNVETSPDGSDGGGTTESATGDDTPGAPEAQIQPDAPENAASSGPPTAGTPGSGDAATGADISTLPASGEAGASDGTESASGDDENIDLQQLVDEELAKRKEALQQSLEAEFQREKQRLEKEIAKAKDDGRASDGKKDDG